MKKIIFVMFVFVSIRAFSQFTLQHTYPDAGHCAPSNVGGTNYYGQKSLYLVHLETSGDKYVKLNKMAQTIEFYSLDYTLWKSVNYSAVPTNVTTDPETDKSQASIIYISEHLFDTDDEIEFMYTFALYYNNTWHATTQIVNEDGTILFSRDAAPLVQPSYPMQYYSIYNTTNGTVMILSNVNGTAEVFSLSGTFTSGIATNNILGNAAEMSLFPNPSMGGNMITINYTLPSDTHTANLLVFDTQGKQVKSYKIGNGMSSILVNPSELAKGTYYYSIQTEDGRSIATQKSIVVQ